MSPYSQYLSVSPTFRNFAMSRPLTSSLTSAIGASLVFLLASPLAVAVTWDGDTSADWGTGTNWAGDVAPDFTESALIDDGGLLSQPNIGPGYAFTVRQTTISAGSLTIGGSLSSNVTVSGSGALTIGAIGVVTGNVTNAGTLFASNGASFAALSNAGLFELRGGTTNFVGALALGASSTLSILVADYQFSDTPITAGNAAIGGTLMLDFTGVVFSDDSWALDLIHAMGGGHGWLFRVSGRGPRARPSVLHQPGQQLFRGRR